MLKKILRASLLFGIPVILFILYGYFLFSALGERPLIDWDEAIYAQVSHESTASNRPFDYTFFGSPWYEKPPLILSLTVGTYKLIGENEFSSRIWSALFAFFTLVLNFWLVKKIFSSLPAAITVLASYLICFHFFFHAYFFQMDTAVGFFILGTLGLFWLGKNNANYYYGCFVFLALGVLTKSVIGLIPLPIILLYSLLANDWAYLKNKEFWLGCLVFIGLAAPWHIWQTFKHGNAFWQNYFFYHVFTRYTKAIENNGGNLYFYLPTLIQNGVFAITLGLGNLYFLFQSLKKQKSYLFFLLAGLFIFVFFSLSKTKGYGYLVIIYPYLITIIGVSIWELAAKIKFDWLQNFSLFVLLVVFFSLGWQQNSYKKFKLNNDQIYLDNKALAKFLKTNYPNKPVYKESYKQADIAVYYYYGKPIGDLPKEISIPKDYTELSKHRVLHKALRSVYYFNDFVYLAP